MQNTQVKLYLKINNKILILKRNYKKSFDPEKGYLKKHTCVNN